MPGLPCGAGRISAGRWRTIRHAADALGAISGGALASTAGIRAPMLAGVAPLTAATALLA